MRKEGKKKNVEREKKLVIWSLRNGGAHLVNISAVNFLQIEDVTDSLDLRDDEIRRNERGERAKNEKKKKKERGEETKKEERGRRGLLASFQ